MTGACVPIARAKGGGPISGGGRSGRVGELQKAGSRGADAAVAKLDRTCQTRNRIEALDVTDVPSPT
jgi:hypothetical protein